MRARDFVLLLLYLMVLGIAAGLSRAGAPPWLAYLGVAVLAVAALLSLDRRRSSRAPRPAGAPYVPPYEVRFDDVSIIVSRQSAADERVTWADLITVGVRIDEAFLPEPWWLLFAPGLKGIQYPSSARGASEMLHELQRRLPGFDNAGVIRAMGMMSGGVVVWERTPAAAPEQHS
jgi:hypothetical protein